MNINECILAAYNNLQFKSDKRLLEFHASTAQAIKYS